MRLTRRALATLAACGAGFLAPRSADALSIADGAIHVLRLGVAPAAGTLQVAVPWEAEAFAQANDSLGGLDQGFDASTGGTASASAAVPWAGSAAAADALALELLASSSTDPPLANSFARSESQSILFTTFSITGGSGAVAVDFSLDLSGLLHGFTDGVGSFQTDAFAALEVDGTQILFELQTLAGGPGFADTSLPFATTLAATRTLEFERTYFLLLEVDAETQALNVPEPGTLALLGLGLLLISGASRCRRGRRA